MTTPLLIQGTALAVPLKDESVHTVCTSPPYFGLRRYDCGPGELGLEDSPDAYIAAMVQVFREVKRVLRNDGVLFINMGDSYRDKQLQGIPWRLAFALQADAWILRSDVIWDKPSCLPESVQDRPTRSHEYVFLFSKQARYFYDAEAVREPHSEPWRSQSQASYQEAHGPKDRVGLAQMFAMTSHREYNPAGRNARTVWRIASEPFSGAHFATYPPALVRRCLLAGAPSAVCAQCQASYHRVMERTDEVATSHNGSRFDVGKSAHHGHVQEGVRYVSTPGELAPTCSCNAGVGKAVVLDPFAGSGTTLVVARELGHHAVGIDLSYPYLRDIARQRLGLTALKAWQEGAAPRQDRFEDLPLFAP